MSNPRAAGRIRRRKECGLSKRDKQMNILRSIALAGISTLLLVGCANSPYASPYDSAHQRSGQVYQTQPRVIIVQPNRQSYGQSSGIYFQQGQVQRYDYYPGLNQQPRYPQQWSQQHQYPRHGQQHRQNRYDDHRDRNRYEQHGGRWSEHQRPDQRRNDQYQRPDYRAQQERYKEQRNQERENWERNRDRMLDNSRQQQYQKDPRRDQNRNYGSGIRQQRAERY